MPLVGFAVRFGVRDREPFPRADRVMAASPLAIGRHELVYTEKPNAADTINGL